MIIEKKTLSGPCTCGRVHSMATQLAVIEKDAMKSLNDRIAQAGLTGPLTAVYDTNTYEAAGALRPLAAQEIILPAEGLSANERSAAQVLRQLDDDTRVLAAIGGGVLHDIVRYCAHRMGIPFVSCPTAASTDGYASGVCAMTWHGAQVILPGVAPVIIVADLSIIRHAPAVLARAGVGEALSKVTALADWRIANLLSGRPSCPTVESYLRQAAVAAEGCCADIARDDERAYGQLMYALLLPGLASQIQQNADPASASEHLMAYALDILPELQADRVPAMHGETVGVMTAIVSGLYHRIAQIDDIGPYLKSFAPLGGAALQKAYGPFAKMLEEANTPDCLESIDPAILPGRWGDIRRIIAEIPTKDALTAMLASVGAKKEPEDLGLSSAKVSRLIKVSPYIRNQLTLLRMLRMLRFRYASSDASRAPSRRSRYADKAITRAGKSSAVSASSMR